MHDAQDAEILWIIPGSSSGAMYGLHEVLSALTGVIWAGPGDDHTLFGPTYELPVKPHRPRFAYRGAYSAEPAWASRQRLNFGMSGMMHFPTRSPQQRIATHEQTNARAITRTRSEHAMDLLLPAEELARHPDWQGMRLGERCTHAHVTLPDCPQLDAHLPIQPCYSNSHVRQAIIKRMVQWCNTKPVREFFGLWPHDGVNNWCECDECVKLTPFEHMYRLSLELGEQLPADHPAAFDLLVYSNILNLPRNPLPASNRAMALFCPYLRPFMHNIFDAGGPKEVVTGCAWPKPDRINPIDEHEYGRLLAQWLPLWQQAALRLRCSSTQVNTSMRPAEVTTSVTATHQQQTSVNRKPSSTPSLACASP